MELHEALTQITEIRARIARTETFRGYRAATVAFSGVVGIGAAIVQALTIPHPRQQVAAYLTLWVSAAALNLLTVGLELSLRCRRAVSPRTTRLTRLAVEQFLPCVAAGVVVTGTLATVAPQALWVLPGLWAVLFSLGVFASCRLLPRPTFWAGVYYLAAGGVCLGLGDGPYALSPWLMAGTFGGGQLLTAAILFWTLERGEYRRDDIQGAGDERF
jgi:hypothetical protein